jgi:hypothetical protein
VPLKWLDFHRYRTVQDLEAGNLQRQVYLGVFMTPLSSEIFGSLFLEKVWVKPVLNFLLCTSNSMTHQSGLQATLQTDYCWDIWEMFISNYTQYYTSSESCTVADQLLWFRGRCPIKIYIQKRSVRYGIQIMTLCADRTFCMAEALQYTGKIQKEAS